MSKLNSLFISLCTLLPLTIIAQKEASGSYLIQYFTDGKKRIFLRQQQNPFHTF
ncbi:hypothetical protein Niako_2647 [Niastella koreensis GR20-10]|uniref:Uncharacterized protein n=1 Tax=Niastella koreensis (strain DSM 17620 / KACC 11465 / NBRC 106392 / GR20-10) TaxID=700598 RepID=G8TR72_NIAKG|nr:hypothetical protein Niako_2647 [Niastella koreensis GR20-10]